MSGGHFSELCHYSHVGLFWWNNFIGIRAVCFVILEFMIVYILINLSRPFNESIKHLVYEINFLELKVTCLTNNPKLKYVQFMF